MAEKVQVFPILEGVNDDGEIYAVSSGQDEMGREVPDPVPMELPIGMTRGPTLADTIRRMMGHELLKRAADEEGFDSAEEADDFNIDDDPLDPQTPYEAVFDPLPPVSPSSPSAAPSTAVQAPIKPNPEPGVASPPDQAKVVNPTAEPKPQV